MAEQQTTSKAKAPVKTIGGQPLWVWGVAGAVMVVAAIYLYRKNAANTGASSGSSSGSGSSGGGAAGGAGPAQYPGTLDMTIQDLQSSPQISKTCPAGYTLATSGPHAGMCVRNTATKQPTRVSTPKTPKGVAA